MKDSSVTVLIVDDEANMRKLLNPYLKNQGWWVIEADSGKMALEKFVQGKPDVIILDVMMPGMDGWQVCDRIRSTSDVPILLLTARGETRDKVYGLSKAGADDYLTKPFEMEELIARVHALLRRGRSKEEKNTGNASIEFAGLLINKNARRIEVYGKEVLFTPKEFDLFCKLASGSPKAYSRELLLQQIWGDDFFGEDRTVDQHIKNIRDKLKKSGLSYNPIQTIWGFGYKFEGKKSNG